MLGEDKTLLWLIGGALFGYFLLTTWLGSRGAAHSGSMKGFAIAKGKVSPWIVGISFGASYSSANLFLRSEEHTSELQSRGHLVCRLLLEKKKRQDITN